MASLKLEGVRIIVDANKTCGTCGWWKPEQREQKSRSTYIKTDPLCTMINKIKHADNEPFSWCWLPATSAQLAIRVKAGLIAEKEGLGNG